MTEQDHRSAGSAPLRVRLAGRGIRREGVAEAIYGTLLAASLIIAWNDESLAGLGFTIVVTGLVFAVTHAYATWLAGEEGAWNSNPIPALRTQLPLAEACLGPAAVLGISRALTNDTRALWVALFFCAAQLVLWSVAAARMRPDTTVKQQVGIVVVAVGLAFVMIELKVLVH